MFGTGHRVSRVFYKGTPSTRKRLLKERDQAFRDVVDVVASTQPMTRTGADTL
jgi:hypothetical protein